MKFSKKSLILITVLSLSTSACSYPQESNILVDESGNNYTIVKHFDDTESLIFMDEEGNDYDEIRIKRNDDNSIDVISGNEDLLLGAITGYLLYHGISVATSSMKYDKDKKQYIPSYAPVILSKENAKNQLNSYQSNIKSSIKSGFGSVGARSSAS